MKKIPLMAAATLALALLHCNQQAIAHEQAIPSQCKSKDGFALVTRAEDAIRIAYAMYRASAPDVTNPIYDSEAAFAENVTASLKGCRWEVAEKRRAAQLFMWIDVHDGRLVGEGTREEGAPAPPN
jgi:hypothetical protein